MSVTETLLQEIEQQRSLIERTAAQWIALNPGKVWEGGIDKAMTAAVTEIRRLRADKALTEAMAAERRALIRAL